jgi:hypothetical protein
MVQTLGYLDTAWYYHRKIHYIPSRRQSRPELDGHDIGLLGGTVSPNHPAYVLPKRVMHS